MSRADKVKHAIASLTPGEREALLSETDYSAYKTADGTWRVIGIPDFLRRKQDAERRDALARKTILAEQTKRKRAKSRNRIEEMKAKQRGDTKRMPLTGRAALEAIRGE